jgi:hypothetical protein
MSASQRYDGGWHNKETEHRGRTQIAKLTCKAEWPVYRNAIEADCYARNSLQCLKYPFHVLIDWQQEEYLQYYPELSVKHAIPSEGLSVSSPTSEADSKVTSSTTDDYSGSSTEQQKPVKEEFPTPGGTPSMQVLAMSKDWRLHCIRSGKATYLAIYSSLHTNQHHLIQGVPLGDPFKLWTTLKNFYQRTSLAARRVLWSSFWSMTGYVRSGSNLDLFVAHLEDLARRLNEMGETVAASHILGSLLNGLPKEYEAIITVIDAELPPDVAGETDGLKFLEEVKDKLRDFAEKRKLTTEGPKRAAPRANAFFSAPDRPVSGGEPCRNHASGRPCASTPCPFSHKGGRSSTRPSAFKKKDHSSNSKPARDKTADTCKNCGKKGHWARECKAPKKHAAHVACTSADASTDEGVHWAFLAPITHPVTAEPDLFELVADVFAVIKETSIEARRLPTHFGSKYSSDVTGDGAEDSLESYILVNAANVIKAIEDRKSPTLFGAEFPSDVTGDGPAYSIPSAFFPTLEQAEDAWRGPLGEMLIKRGKILRNDLKITHGGLCFFMNRVSNLFPPQVWRDSPREFKMEAAKKYKIELLFLIRQLGPYFCLSDWMGPEHVDGDLSRVPLYAMMACESLIPSHPHYGKNGEVTAKENRAHQFYTLLDKMRLKDGYQADGIVIALDAFLHGALDIVLVADDLSKIFPAIQYHSGPRAAHVTTQVLVLYKQRYETISPHTYRQLNNRRHGGMGRIFGDSSFPAWVRAPQRLIPYRAADGVPGPESYFVWLMQQFHQDHRRYIKMQKLLVFFKTENVWVNLKTSTGSMQWTFGETGGLDLKFPGNENGWFGFTLEEATEILPDLELTLKDRQAVLSTVDSCRTQAMEDMVEGKELPLPQIFIDMLEEVHDQLPLPQIFTDIKQEEVQDEEMLSLDGRNEHSDSDNDDEPMTIKIEETNWRCKMCAYENEPPYADCTMCANTPPHMIKAMQRQAKQRRKRTMASPGGCYSYF